MTHTLPASTVAAPRENADPPEPTDPTFAEMLEEVIDLCAGLVAVLLPLFVLSVPGIILFVVLPAILLLALALPLAVIAAVIGVPPYLIARWLRRRARRTSSRPGRSGALRPSI